MQPNPQIHKTNSSQPAERTTDPYPENTLRQPKVQPQMNVQQSFAHEIPVPAPVNPVYECCLSTAGAILGFFGALPCCCCCPNPFKIVLQGEVGLVTKFGKYYKSVDPGLHQINVLTEALFKLNMKIQVVDIPAQVITTKDNVSVIIDSILYWHIQDPYSAAFLVNDVRQALIERTQTTLRQIMGTRTLQEVFKINQDYRASRYNRRRNSICYWSISAILGRKG